MTTAKYFKYAFAIAGDKTAVPNTTQVDGSVSYQEGFGFAYQRAKTDPLAKNIPRNQTNELFADLSGAIKQYQENAFPDWITTADNDGVAYQYRAGDYVRYTDGVVYRSLVAANVAVPGTDATKWAPFLWASADGTTGYVLWPTGTVMQWGTGNTATGYLDTVTYPLTFPNAARMVIASEAAVSGWAPTTPSFTVYGTALVDASSFHISGVRLPYGGSPVYQAGLAYGWIAVGH